MNHGVQHGAEGRVPVFVFPSNLSFFTDDQSTHKQVLTIYNPYDFSLKYRVLSTTPKNYVVVDSEGSIKKRCCADVVIRHKAITFENEGVRDKFRIQVYEQGQKQAIGRKDVLSLLLPTADKSQTEENFEALGRSSPEPCSSQSSTNASSPNREKTSGPGYVILIIAALCIFALSLPTEGDNGSVLPKYAFLTVHQKLIAAYILGLVTISILKS